MFKVNKFQVKITTNLLTNNHYAIQFAGNTLFIKSDFEYDKVMSLLDRNHITYKVIQLSNKIRRVVDNTNVTKINNNT